MGVGYEKGMFGIIGRGIRVPIAGDAEWLVVVLVVIEFVDVGMGDLSVGGELWWIVVLLGGHIGGVWVIFVGLLLISLGDVAYSVLIVSMVLRSRIMDVKLGVLCCFFAILWVVCGFFDLDGFGRRRKRVL